MFARTRSALVVTSLFGAAAASIAIVVAACGSSSDSGSPNGGILGAGGDDSGSLASGDGAIGSTGTGDGGANGGGTIGSGTGDGGSSDPNLTADMYVAQYCALFDGCCSATARTAPGAACIMSVGIENQPGSVYDVDAANACLTAAKAEVAKGTFCPAADAGAPVASTSDPLAICANVFAASKPTRNLGQSCSVDSDCIAASTGRTSCNLTVLADGGALNTCLQVLPGMQSSAPCIDDTGAIGDQSHPPMTAYSCAQSAGLYCEDSNHLCKLLKATGVSCQDDSECVTADYCSFETTNCQPRIADGQACPDGVGCVTGDFCNMSTSKCTALLANGSPSTDPTTCASTVTSGGNCVSYADYVLDAYCH